MNPLIYVISIILGIFILYHLRENIKNLWAVKEGLSLMGKDLNKTGRCANYKVSGRWVRDGVFSGGGSLEDCANRFGEDGGVFSYNPNSKGCLYTKTNEPHYKYSIKGIRSGCKPEGWGGGWRFYKAEKKIPSKRLSNHRQPTTTVYNTITANCMPSTTLILIGKNPRKPKRNTIIKKLNSGTVNGIILL